MKKKLLSSVKFFGLIFLAFSFSVSNAGGKAFDNLAGGGKKGKRFAPLPAKAPAYKYRSGIFKTALNFGKEGDQLKIENDFFFFTDTAKMDSDSIVYDDFKPEGAVAAANNSEPSAMNNKGSRFTQYKGILKNNVSVKLHSPSKIGKTLFTASWKQVIPDDRITGYVLQVSGNADFTDLVRHNEYYESQFKINGNKFSLPDFTEYRIDKNKFSQDIVGLCPNFTYSQIQNHVEKGFNLAELKKSSLELYDNLKVYYKFNQGIAGGDNFLAEASSIIPEALPASEITQGSFTANWRPVAEATDYFIDVARDEGFTNFVPGYNGKAIAAGNTNYTVSGLSPDFTYYYRVRAKVETTVSDNSKVIQARTLHLTRLGNYLNFDGVDDYVSLPTGIDLPKNSWTEELWVYIPADVAADDGYKNVIGSEGMDRLQKRSPFIFIHNNTSLHGGYGNGVDVQITYDAGNVLTVNAWNHIAQTYDGTTLTAYVNGEMVKSVTGAPPGGSSAINSVKYFGSRWGFRGTMDELRFWNYARSANDIKTSYTAAVDKNLPGLIAYYDFNQGIAGGDNAAINILNDNKKAYDATLHNFAKTGETGNFNGYLWLVPPTASAADNVGSVSFTAKWRVPEGSSPTHNKYFIDVSTDAGFAADKFVMGYNNREVGNVTEWEVTGLNPRATYYYRVRAGYDNPWYHSSANSNSISVETVMPHMETKNADKITPVSFLAKWEAPKIKVDGYVLEVAREKDAGSNLSNFVYGYEKLPIAATATSFEVTGLNPNAPYFYKVKGVVGTETITSNVTSVKTSELNGLGNALNFDGTNDFVSLSATGINLPEEGWTQEMWVNIPNEAKTGVEGLIGGDNMDTWQERGVFLQIYDRAKLQGGYGSGSNSVTYNTENVLVRGSLNHIAQTYDKATKTLIAYVNGKEIVKVTEVNIPNAKPVKYLGQVAGTDSYFKGIIDEFRIWKRALSATEISGGCTTTVNKNHSDLLAYYDFNQGIDKGDNTAISLVNDNKNAYHAAFNNFALKGAESNFVGNLTLTPPKALQADNVSGISFKAKWEAPIGSTPSHNKYFIDVSTDKEFAEGKFVKDYNNKNVGNITEIDITGLDWGVTYYYRVRAGYADPWYHSSVSSNAITVTTLLQTNTIALAAADVKTYGDAPYQLAVSSSGTGAYTYTVSSGAAVSINNTGQVTILKAGTATIVVTQTAYGGYASGGPVTQTITVQPKGLTVAFKAADKEYNGSNTASVTVLSLTETVYGDVITAFAGGATFDNKDVGVNKPVAVTGVTLAGAKASNYVLANISATPASITAKPVTVTLKANDKVFDGNNTATGSFAIAGQIADDDVKAAANSILFDDAKVGLNKPVTASGLSLTGADQANYKLLNTTATSTGNITGKGVMVTIKSVFAKVYDGVTTASATFNVEGLSGETVTVISADVNFGDKTAGVGKSVTASNFKLSNANYSVINLSATATGTITAKGVTVTLKANDKVFDGNNTATGSFALAGQIADDDVKAAANSILFDDAKVGLNKPVTASGLSLTGADQANYKLLNTTATSTGNIMGKGVMVTIKSVFAKVYDGVTTASATFNIEGVTDGVTVISADVNFGDKTAGVGKEVTASNFKLSNANYSVINLSATATGTITAKGVTVTLKANDKVFDGNNTATGSFAIAGQIADDDVKAAANSILFDDAKVGLNKPVTASGLSLTGADQANYKLLNTTATSTGNIMGKRVTVTIKSVFAKVYDGVTTASATFNVEGLSGETVTVISADVHFADKNAGAGKSVTASNFKLSDANYAAFNLSATSTGNITAKGVTVTLKANDKVFDGNNTATGSFALAGQIADDDVKAAANSILFDDAKVGLNKPVTASGLSLTGADQANYKLLNTTATSTGNIMGKGVTVTIKSVFAKVYDGVTTASATFNIEGVTDGVTVISADVNFGDKNAGEGKSVTASNFKLSDANYAAFNLSATSTGNITAKGVTVTLKANDKVFDGNNTATGSFAIAGQIADDDVKAAANSILFDDAKVGLNKPVTASGLNLTGADQANYKLLNTTATSTGNITGKGVMVTIKSVFAKVYDGVTTASATFNIEGVTDGVTVISANVHFADKNAGEGKSVTASNFKLSDANYAAFNLSATSTGNITAKGVTVTLKANDKVFDGNNTATGSFAIAGQIADDDVKAVANSILFDDAKVGLNKPVTASGLSLTGADQANYKLLNTTATSTGNITGKGVMVTIKSVFAKVYDGVTTASATFNIEGVTDGVTVISADVHFADKNAGAGKSVTASNFKLSDANYAAFNLSATSTGNITAKGVTVTLKANDKVFDGNNTATGSFAIAGQIADDDVKAAANSILFDDAKVGLNKPVTASGLSLTGADQANYKLLNTTATSTGNIMGKGVTVTIKSVFAKVYDGVTTASATFNIEDVTDGVTVASADVNFADKNAGAGKAVTASNFKLSNANYAAFNLSATSTGNITAKGVTVTLKANDKVFDGNNTATGSFAIAGQIADDDVKAAANSILFDDAKVGLNKPVTASGLSLTGADQANYKLLNTTATSTGNIMGKGVTVTIKSVFAKVYDGVTTASATFNIEDVTDGVTVASADVNFADKNAGAGKAVTASNFKLSNANYSVINLSATATGNITPKDLIITADNKTKLPGEDNPPLTAGYSGFVRGENNTNALTVQPLITTSATKTSPPGIYPIEASGAVAANNNYNIIYNKGALTISTVEVTAATLTLNTLLYENSPTGTLAGTFTASSTHPKAIYAYSLVPGAVDNSKFTINGDKLYTNAIFNYAAQSAFTIRVQITTQGGGMFTKDFVVAILYVNKRPTLDAIPNQSVCATTESHTINLSGITPGAESDQTTTLSISSDRVDMFNTLSVAPLAGGKGVINYSLKAGVKGSAVVTVTVKDNGGTIGGGVDTYAVSFTVNANEFPAISISTSGGKLKVIRGRTLELTANAPGATSYLWVDAKGIISGRNAAKLTIKPTENTVYMVKATTAAGCAVIKQILIEVGNEYSDVVISNIITTNGDGVNDVWIVENIEHYPNVTVKVFDRAGRLMFSQRGYDNKWNGYFNGKPLHQGAYYYVIDFDAGLYKAKGYITILN